MDTSLEIKSSVSSATLQFEKSGADSLVVRVSRPEVSATFEVYYEEFSGLVELLESVGRDWRGWSGNRVWESDEGTVLISCKTDCRGHVFLTVSLRKDFGQPEPWLVQFQLNTEPAQIEILARQMRKELLR